MKRCHCVLLLTMLGLLTGCLQKEILDDVKAVTIVGFDRAEGNQIRVTALVPTYLPDKTLQSETFSATSYLSKQVRDELNNQVSHPIVSGKIQVVLISERLARTGIMPHLDTLTRDPSIGSRVYLAITEGETTDIIKRRLGQEDVGVFISNMLKHNIEAGTLPRTSLHQFLYSYYADGHDPSLPLLRLKGEKVIIDGIALFQGDKMVARLNDKQMFTYKSLLQKKAGNGSILLIMKSDKETDNSESKTKQEYAAVNNIVSKRKFVAISGQPGRIAIRLKMTAAILEYSGPMLDPNEAKRIEKTMTEEVTSQAQALVKQLQEWQIDPLGIGNYMASRTRHWDEQQWQDRYPNADISVEVNVNIAESGVQK